MKQQFLAEVAMGRLTLPRMESRVYAAHIIDKPLEHFN
jgi:hypothetical protein